MTDLGLALVDILRRADEHFNQVIVQGVIELALEGPLELGMIEIPRMHFERVSVYRHRRVLELNYDFHALAFRTSGKREQRVLIMGQLAENTLQA
jgi:hypothetical protein